MNKPWHRRLINKSLLSTAVLAAVGRAGQSNAGKLYPDVKAGRQLAFPGDHGAHPDYRTEWWYLTAWLQTQGGPAGLQITFFRSRTTHGRDNPSRLAARQLLFAHAALALPWRQSLLHAQLAARLLPGQISQSDTAIHVGSAAQPWQMLRTDTDRYEFSVQTDEFAISGSLKPPGPPVLQGNAGFSRKGPLVQQASYYYSRPQLALKARLDAPMAGTSGRIATTQVTGLGWLDHEWSSELLDANAAGWDWVGLNLDDGSALMAFQIRTKDGAVQFAHARWIRNHRAESAATPRFGVLRQWRSPRTDVSYPVQQRLQIGNWSVELAPLFDDQEMDTRASTGILYWEGAIAVLQNGKRIGRGYLELTGYGGKVRL